MNEDRLQQLIEKRDGPGLTDDEADELERLMTDQEAGSGAERAGAAASAQEDQREDEARRDKAPSSFEIVESERETQIEER